MKLKPFALERWMTTWEMEVTHDICESGILPMSLRDLYDLIGPEEAARLAEDITTMPQMYSEARGTEALRSILASTYVNTTAENILVTTGAIEANFLLFNSLVGAGDHVVAVTPAYQQLNTLPEALGARV